MAAENFVISSFIICTLRQYFNGNKVKKNAIDGARTTLRGYEKYVQNFSLRT
jgi:hypothetical protein